MSETGHMQRTSERFDGSNHLTAPDTFEDIRCGFLVALSKAFQTRRFLPPGHHNDVRVGPRRAISRYSLR